MDQRVRSRNRSCARIPRGLAPPPDRSRWLVGSCLRQRAQCRQDQRTIFHSRNSRRSSRSVWQVHGIQVNATETAWVQGPREKLGAGSGQPHFLSKPRPSSQSGIRTASQAHLQRQKQLSFLSGAKNPSTARPTVPSNPSREDAAPRERIEQVLTCYSSRLDRTMLVPLSVASCRPLGKLY